MWLVGWSLTPHFSTNTAISETKAPCDVTDVSAVRSRAIYRAVVVGRIMRTDKNVQLKSLYQGGTTHQECVNCICLKGDSRTTDSSIWTVQNIRINLLEVVTFWWHCLKVAISVISILNAVRCPYVTYVRTSVTVGVASSVANDVTMRMTSQ